MCIAIAKPKGYTIFKDVLETCFENNSDGAGFAYSDQGIMVIEKGFFTFEDFYKAYEPHETKQCLVHFRIKTHGPLSEENCHPFSINDTNAFIHNGVIFSHGGNVDKSDTRDFNENILTPLVQEYGDSILTSPHIKTLIEKYIGGSKLVFMNSLTEEFEIYNEGMGDWVSGVWFSNNSWKKYTPPVYNFQKKKHKSVWEENEDKVFDNRFNAPLKKEEVSYIMKYVDSKPVKVEKNTYLKAIANVYDKNNTAVLIKDDLYCVEKCWSNYQVDVFNPLENKTSESVSLSALQPFAEEELTTYFGV